MQSSSENFNFKQWQIILLGVGILALLACGVGWFFAPSEFFRAFLPAFVFWTGLAIGCLAVLMLQFLTGGAWGLILRRALFAASLTLPLLAVLFVPLIFGLHSLYIWTIPDIVASDEVLLKKQGFLNVPFFLVRQLIYFAVWIGFAFLLNFWERKRRETESAEYVWRLEYLSGAGLFALAITLTLALVDWVMSLEPRWYSTVYAVIWICGNMLAAFAFSISAVLLLTPPEAAILNAKRMRDLGNLLLAFVLLWAYVSFSQYLLIWSGNLPEEITWYLPRVNGFWGFVALGLIILHFFAPFFLLLTRDFKESGKWLSAIALFLFVMRFIDALWLIEPSFATVNLVLGLLNLAAVVGIGGVWLACFLWLFERRSEPPARAGGQNDF